MRRTLSVQFPKQYRNRNDPYYKWLKNRYSGMTTLHKKGESCNWKGIPPTDVFNFKILMQDIKNEMTSIMYFPNMEAARNINKGVHKSIQNLY